MYLSRLSLNSIQECKLTHERLQLRDKLILTLERKYVNPNIKVKDVN